MGTTGNAGSVHPSYDVTLNVVFAISRLGLSNGKRILLGGSLGILAAAVALSVNRINVGLSTVNGLGGIALIVVHRTIDHHFITLFNSVTGR